MGQIPKTQFRRPDKYPVVYKQVCSTSPVERQIKRVTFRPIRPEWIIRLRRGWETGLTVRKRLTKGITRIPARRAITRKEWPINLVDRGEIMWTDSLRIKGMRWLIVVCCWCRIAQCSGPLTFHCHPWRDRTHLLGNHVQPTWLRTANGLKISETRSTKITEMQIAKII